MIANDGSPWVQRRIVFQIRAVEFFDNGGALIPFFLETSNGMVRLQNRLTPAIQLNVFNYIFQGQINADWSDPLVAKIDTKRVKLFSDRLNTINPGSQSGGVRVQKYWYPTNKSFIYNDDEAGESVQSSYISNSVSPMKDLFILDFFQNSGTTSDTLQWRTEGTYYWHER